MMLEDEVKELLDIQDIKSFLHAYIYAGDEVLYAIGFDDCARQRLWSPIEISTLLHVSKIIAQFLNYKNMLADTQTVSEERLSALDSLNYFSYIVDPETHKISYYNAFTKRKVPSIEVGDTCYAVLRGLNEQCPDCPMRAMQEQSLGAMRMVLKDTSLGEYTLVNASELTTGEGKKSVFIAAHDITDVLQSTHA